MLIRYMKNVRIRSISGSYFSTFGVNADHKNAKYGHFPRSDPQAENVYHPTFKFILKYKNDSSVYEKNNKKLKHFVKLRRN